MHRFFVSMGIAAGLAASALRADDAASTPRWSLTAECQMVVLPQKVALLLIAELSDDSKIEAAWATVQGMIDRDAATLIANIVLKGVAGKKLISESFEELRYPIVFDPPYLPHDVPKEKAAEVLKNWPIVGITPTAFETRNVGATLELEANVSDDGAWISAVIIPQHVRFLRFTKYDAGIMPSGERLSVEQPQFHTTKNTLTMHLRAGQRVLAGVHKLHGEENLMELFVVRISVQKTGTPK